MKLTKHFVALKATDDDLNDLKVIQDALRKSKPFTTRADVIRFALRTAVREVSRD